MLFQAGLRQSVQDDWLLDLNILPLENRRKHLLVADMDSTIIGCECIDELADMAGLNPKLPPSPNAPCAASSIFRPRCANASRC